MHRDGVDAKYPIVEAQSLDEACRLATPFTIFRCPDGTDLTFTNPIYFEDVMLFVVTERRRGWFERAMERSRRWLASAFDQDYRA